MHRMWTSSLQKRSLRFLSGGGAQLPAAELQRLVGIRKDIHAHPELGFNEFRTSDLVSLYLESCGIEVHREIAETGLVGTIHGKGGSSTRAIAFRADMDCLPMQEGNLFSHKSKFDNLHHGCGHDGHTTILLGAAKYLSQHRDAFDGKIRLIFQPAEEGQAGAKRMIDEGLFDRFPCQEIYGIHNWPLGERGKIYVKPGPLMASADEFDIEISGTGGHAAIPQHTADPIPIAASLISSLQTSVSRRQDPLRACVISVTKVLAGSAYNVIPDKCVLSGTVRTFSEEDRSRIEEDLDRLVTNICIANGARGHLRYRRGYPATINHQRASEYAFEAARATVGADMVVTDFDSTLGAEDFSFFLNDVPGCYAWIGSNSEGMLHQPNFDFDDEIIPTGVAFFVNIARQRLQPGAHL